MSGPVNRRTQSKPIAETENPLVGPIEASELLGIGQTTFKRWIDTGAIPAHRTLGGHRRVMKADLLAFAAAQGIPLLSKNDRKKRILLVDDEPGFLKTLAVRLRAHFSEMEILAAENAYEAGAIVTKLRPEAVLVDLHMPGVNGAEFCRWITKTPETSETFVIGMTGSRVARDHEELRRAGAEAVLVKPFEKSEVIGALERCFPVRGVR